MGFITREQRGSKFLNFKEGKIIHSEDGQLKSYDGFSGRIIDLDIEDAEYQSSAYRKIVLFIEDSDTGNLYELGFKLESGYGNSFCCIAPNIDWKEPVEISGKIEKKPDGKSYSGMFISQNKGPVKWRYTNKSDEGQKDPKKKRPAPESVTVGAGRNAKSALDFSKRNDFYEKLLIHIRKNSIVPATGGLAAYKPKRVKPTDPLPEMPGAPDDDLPF